MVLACLTQLMFLNVRTSLETERGIKTGFSHSLSFATKILSILSILEIDINKNHILHLTFLSQLSSDTSQKANKNQLFKVMAHVVMLC